jgi:hypothetical protein
VTQIPERRLLLAGWMREFGITLIFYFAAYAGAMWAALTLPFGATRTVLSLLPIAPGLVLIWSAVRSYRRSDEFIRLRILQATAVCAVVTAIWTLAYSYLELIGLPRLNIGVIHGIAWPLFVVQMVRLMRSV